MINNIGTHKLKHPASIKQFSPQQNSLQPIWGRSTFYMWKKKVQKGPRTFTVQPRVSRVCSATTFWRDLPNQVVCRARYPKASLEGGHYCRLAACNHFRMMLPHESLMKEILLEQRKTLISHINHRETGKGANRPRWLARRVLLRLPVSQTVFSLQWWLSLFGWNNLSN